MARYEHLPLLRLPERFERRKRPGFGSAPSRNFAEHSAKIRVDLDTAVSTQQRRRTPGFVDPSLILRVRVTGGQMEDDWAAVGLTILSTDTDRTLVLFASSDDMQEFRSRLAAYADGIPANKKTAHYNGFISSIEAIGSVEPRDRIGQRFREQGFVDGVDFQSQILYLVDIELWDLGDRKLRERKLTQIVDCIENLGGEVLDRFVGSSITMLRARAYGALLQTLLSIEDIATIDSPPQSEERTGETLEMVLGDTPPLNVFADDAPLIGVIDSGTNDHPFLKDIFVGTIGVPESLGTADDWGHGTRVSGIAVFGDLRAQLDAETLNRGARLCSAKVVNAQGRFDDRRLVPSQMREAIETLNKRFNCRIFVIALCDITKPYDGGKVGAWAATLDELARELDVVIVVSSGNESPRNAERLDEAITEYPSYLLEPTNRFYEPAGALNVLTVGAIAHGEGLDFNLSEDVRVKPITRSHEPSPFSRIGPGVGGATKPDLVDIGGTLVFDPVLAKLHDGTSLPSAGVLTTHHAFLDRLFTTGSGTSYAAPRVAFSAAQVLSRFPRASANLVRALLIGSAEIPEASLECLRSFGAEVTRNICGHGQVDLERAAFSESARVMMFSEDELEIDHFAVYRIPIPEPFQSELGERSIRVTLVFDPPVRHTRNDYAGVRMSFRLIRGCEPNVIFEHYRKRNKKEGPFPEIEGRYNCVLEPKATARERGTVQFASVTFKKNVTTYGDAYYLVVRCEGGWAKVDRQRFAVLVEISHKAEIQLYEMIQQRIRLSI